MFHRRMVLIALPAFVCIGTIAQRQQSDTRADVYINVTYENDRPAAQLYRVQLLSSGRMPLSDQFTNDRGQVAFHGIGTGSYQVVVTGTDIEPAELNFSVNPRETTRIEYVRVKRKPDPNVSPGGSGQETISAAALNIPNKAHKEFDKGLAANAKQDLAGARQHFARAVEIYPQYSLALVNLGVISMLEGDNHEGERFFQEAIQADPQIPNGYTCLARVKILQSKYDEADALLNKALSIRPLDPEPLAMLVSSQLRAGKYAEAIANAKKVHSVPHEHYTVVHLLAAQALMQEHLPDMAADEYRLFLKESPDGPRAVSARAALQSIEARTK